MGAGVSRTACLESQFRLADSSPIPRSLEAAGAPRSSLSITLTNHSVSNKYVLRLEDSNGRLLQSVDCTGRSSAESVNGGTRITRILETCGGIDEVFEFRGAGWFHVISRDAQD